MLIYMEYQILVTNLQGIVYQLKRRIDKHIMGVKGFNTCVATYRSIPVHNKMFFSSIDGPLESNQKIPCCTVLPFIRVTCISVKAVD